MHPKLLVDMLKNTSVRPAYINRINKLENTMASVVLFLESDTYPDQVQTTNYYEFDMESSTGNGTDYMALMTVNPEAESSGRRSFTVIKPVEQTLFEPFIKQGYPGDYESYSRVKDQVADKMIEQICSKFPELAGNLRVLDVSTPVTFNRYTRTVDGCMYGVKQCVSYRGLTTRTSVRNLFLAGQSIQMGVMGSVVSGFIAAMQIVDNKRLEKEIRLCL
ncbi:MAG: hypothetical protein P8X42_14605, partial [Calditrichaceae bacterium]